MNNSNDKTILITGGGNGIGAAIAEKMGSLGYNVAIVGRTESRLSDVADRLRENGTRVFWHVCDAGDWEQVNETISLISDKLGRPTVLVNNAGGWIGEKIEDIGVDRFEQLVRSSLMGTMFFSKAVIPLMKRNGGGFILNIGSTSGLYSSLDTAASSSPKAAVHSFTRAFAREVASYGIRVGVLHPARVNRKISAMDAEIPNADGEFKNISPRQVAEIAAFMIEQPKNLIIRELIVTPVNVI